MALRRIAVAGALTAQTWMNALQLVEHERGEGIAFDVFSDNEQRLFLLGDHFQRGIRLLAEVIFSS